MKTSSSRVFPDAEGTWWARNSDGSRTRCYVGKCCYCGEDFASFPQSRAVRATGRKPLHCTQSCYFQCRLAGGHPKMKPVNGRGPESHRWSGGRIKRKGYWLIYMPDHHSIAGKGTQRVYVLEHRVIMEGILGRPLLRTETVHHISGDGLDNRPENLQLRQGNHGQGAIFTCNACGSHDVKSVRLAG